MTFKQPELPYAEDALEPLISARTVQFHYGKHHAGYVSKLNKGIGGTKFASMGLEDIIRETAGSKEHIGVFRNAAQTWNHSFYWHCMKPGGGGPATGDIAGKIDASFGGFDAFGEKFADAAAGEFGSGWAWLVQTSGGELRIVSTTDAETPVLEGVSPLLTCDVWEHAYYLDYQNRRPDYIKAFLDHLVNWDFVNEMLGMDGFQTPYSH